MTKEELLGTINKVAKNQQIKHLFLPAENITALPPEIGQLTNLTSLYLSDNQLTTLPPEIGQLSNLIELNLSNNQLITLPPEIGQLSNLIELNLYNNQLTALPSEIDHLTKLTRLYLYDNQLTILPPEIGQLSNLVRFYLYNNQLTALPSEIGKLTNLRELNLYDNQLTILPPEIGQLTNLKELNLYDNQLISLHPEIANLVNLENLNLGNNRLSTLPPEIGCLTNLRKIDLDRNPDLRQPPPEFIAKGTRAILRYLRELKEKGEEKQFRAKIIFVGEGDVGKTCTLHQLKGHGFVKEQETTHGIDVGTLVVEHPAEKDITMTLNTWDFGGQHIYHATHQFFLTKRSLYILCWNARKDPNQCKLDWWLRTINSLAPDSPIILLATHIDERSPDVNYTKYCEKYFQLVGNHAVSNKDGRGIEELRGAIQEAAAKLPQMGESWPTNWFNVKEKIDELENHHISKNEFIDLCNEQGVKGDTVWILTSWLHDLGNILYFYEDVGLEDMVILQPEWITKAISKVLEDDKARETYGIIDHNRLAEIWKDYNKILYPSFLRLMEKFDLSYRIQGTNTSVVAELLPFEPPKYDLPTVTELPESECRLTMNFKMNFVPAGVMTWFIVRTHRFTKELHWRDGVYLEHEGHKAKAELDTERRVFTLEVQGVMPHNFFSILKDSVDVILNRFPGLKVDRYIPCICHEIRKKEKPCLWKFSYENLIKRFKSRKNMAECQGTYEEVSIVRLLFGIHPSTNYDVLTAIKKLGSHIDQRYEQMADLIMRNFLRFHNFELSKLEADCPSLVTISPRDKGPFKEEKIFSFTYDVQLWCQMPGCPHLLLDGGYELKQPKKWLTKLTPWLRTMLESMKYIPAMPSIVRETASAALRKATPDKCKAMEKLVGYLGRVEEAKYIHDDRKYKNYEILDIKESTTKITGAELRVIFELLDYLDKSHYWGGLRKTISPEGDILWLCPEHYKIFDPGLPVLKQI